MIIVSHPHPAEFTLPTGTLSLLSLTDEGTFDFLVMSLANLRLKDMNLPDFKLSLLIELNVSHNLIESLDSLSFLRYLRILYASHNSLTDSANWVPPESLQYVDLSNNMISNFGNWMNCNTSLNVLILNGNCIRCIPVQSFTFEDLSILCIADNDITDIGGIKEIRNLMMLNLSGNSKLNLHEISNLQRLSYLNLANMDISSVDLLRGLKKLQHMDISNTRVPRGRASVVNSLIANCPLFSHLITSKGQWEGLDTNFDGLKFKGVGVDEIQQLFEPNSIPQNEESEETHATTRDGSVNPIQEVKGCSCCLTYCKLICREIAGETRCMLNEEDGKVDTDGETINAEMEMNLGVNLRNGKSMYSGETQEMSSRLYTLLWNTIKCLSHKSCDVDDRRETKMTKSYDWGSDYGSTTTSIIKPRKFQSARLHETM